MIILFGRNNSETHIPTTSSMTTTGGSSPNRFSSTAAAAVPMKNVTTVAIRITGVRSKPGIKYNSNPTALPAVPGANGEYPEYIPVAMNCAMRYIGVMGCEALGVCCSGIDFLDKFSIIDNVHDSCGNRADGYEEHHAVEDIVLEHGAKKRSKLAAKRVDS